MTTYRLYHRNKIKSKNIFILKLNSLGYYLFMSENTEEIKENSPVEEEVKTEEATSE